MKRRQPLNLSSLDPLETGAYHFALKEKVVDVEEAFQALVVDSISGVSIPIISARFHNGWLKCPAGMMLSCAAEGICEVAMSGGVWQNMTYWKGQRQFVRGRFYGLYSRQVPTNDGDLSLGQAMVGASKYGV